MHRVKVASGDYTAELATSAGGLCAIGVESYMPSLHIGGYIPVDPSSSSLSNALAPPPDRPRLRVRTASATVPDVQVKSESDAPASVPIETSSPGRTPSPPSPTSLPSESPATPPEELSDELQSSEPEETTWALIPYDVPWGDDFVDYQAGKLPGPEGNCLFLRSPTPVEKRRAAQACQLCRERKAKCSGERPCTRCIEKGMHCEYAPEPRRTSISSRDSVVQPRRRSTTGTASATVAPLAVHPYSPRTARRPRLAKMRSTSLVSTTGESEYSVYVGALWSAMASPASTMETELESTWNSPYASHSNFDADEPTARASSAFYCGSYAFAETFANSNESRDAEAMRIDTVTHSAPVVTVGPPRSPDLTRQPTVRAPVAAAARSMPSIPLHAPRPCRRSPTPSFLSAATADQTTVTNYPAARAHPSSSASSSSSSRGSISDSELAYPYPVNETSGMPIRGAYMSLSDATAICKADTGLASLAVEAVPITAAHTRSNTISSSYYIDSMDSGEATAVEPVSFILPSFTLGTGADALMYDVSSATEVMYSVDDGAYVFVQPSATSTAMFAG